MQSKKTISIIIRSTLFWLIMVIVTLPIGILTAGLILANVKLRHKLITQWGVIFTFLAKHLCNIKYEVYGQENLPQSPAIIASNHQSTWETVAFISIFPQHVWVLKKELLKIPVFGWALSTLSPIAINRNNPLSAALQVQKQSVKRIAKGFWILVFPEGTRVAPKTNHPYKTGVAKMALSLQLPVIPVAHNAGYVMPKSSFLLYPGIVKVIIDKPIYPLNNEDPEQLTERIRQVIVNNLQQIG